MNPKISAKDFFLHIATIASLYIGTIALLNLLFTVINAAFPRFERYYFYDSSSLSFPVATLIVVFPLFLFLSNLLQRSYAEDPARKEYPVRRWLIYVTLFIAGGVLAGDLVTLIYHFLDGQEITTGFLLKILAVLVVMGAIFGYYTDDLKGRLTGEKRLFWRVGAVMLVLGAVIWGFSVLGSPQSQREIRQDRQKVEDLSGIQWQIVNFWQNKEVLPASLAELEDPISGYTVPRDPETDTAYEYRRTGNLSFELCAVFNRPAPKPNSNGYSEPMMPIRDMYGMPGNFEHEAGRTCFTRTIDPERYPPARPL